MIDYKSAEGFSSPSSYVIDYLHSLPWQDISQLPDYHSALLKNDISELLHLDQDNICIGNGISEFINILPALIKEEFGDGVTSIVITPTYKPLLDAGHKCGHRTINIPLDESRAFEWDREITKELVQIQNEFSGYRVFWFCSPNNPCGTIIPVSTFELLARDPKNTLIIDEAFIEYLTNRLASSTTSLIKKYNNIIILRTFSKIYSCAGLRIGYAVSDKKWINKISKHTLYYNTSVIAQACASLAIKDQKYISDLRLAVQHARKDFYKKVTEISHVKIGSYSQSNLIILKSNNVDLYNYLFQNNISTKRLLGLEGMPNGYVRISLKSAQDNIPLIELLKMIT